jgi:hypothetical protein
MGTSEKDGGKPSAFDQRLDFFQNEGKDCLQLVTFHFVVPDLIHYTDVTTFVPAGMSIKELKEAVLTLVNTLLRTIICWIDFFTKRRCDLLTTLSNQSLMMARQSKDQQQIAA